MNTYLLIYVVGILCMVVFAICMEYFVTKKTIYIRDIKDFIVFGIFWPILLFMLVFGYTYRFFEFLFKLGCLQWFRAIVVGVALFFDEIFNRVKSLLFQVGNIEIFKRKDENE